MFILAKLHKYIVESYSETKYKETTSRFIDINKKCILFYLYTNVGNYCYNIIVDYLTSNNDSIRLYIIMYKDIDKTICMSISEKSIRKFMLTTDLSETRDAKTQKQISIIRQYANNVIRINDPGSNYLK